MHVFRAALYEDLCFTQDLSQHDYQYNREIIASIAIYIQFLDVLQARTVKVMPISSLMAR